MGTLRVGGIPDSFIRCHCDIQCNTEVLKYKQTKFGSINLEGSLLDELIAGPTVISVSGCPGERENEEWVTNLYAQTRRGTKHNRDTPDDGRR